MALLLKKFKDVVGSKETDNYVNHDDNDDAVTSND